MTTKTKARSTALDIAHAAYAAAVNLEQAQDARDWADVTVMRRYCAVLRSIRVRVIDAHTVQATVAPDRDGRTWAYVAADVLDSAAGRVLDPQAVIAGHILTSTYGAILKF